MNTSSKFVVATHILTTIAARQMLMGRPTPVKSNFISESVNTNPVVIRRILGKLREANLVDSAGGKEGGSWLIQEPKHITLKEIYEAVEDGELFRFHYHDPNPRCPVGSNIQDIMRRNLSGAEDKMKASLAEITLEDVTREIFDCSGVTEMMKSGMGFEKIAKYFMGEDFKIE